MRLKNNTNLDTATIRKLIAFAKPPGISGFDVRIANSVRHGDYRGVAYPRGHGYHDRSCPFIVVSVGRDDRHRGRAAHGGYLDAPPMTRVEVVLWVLAHEMRHLWQARVRRGRRVWGSRGQFSERDADAYALRALRHWRRGEPMP